MPSDYLFKLFPTARHKKSFYPIRPLFTLAQSLLLLGLGIVGVWPLSWAIWAFMIIGVDDLFATPFMRATQTVENLINHRKKHKALVSLISIALGITIGLVLALFVLSHAPIIVGLIQTALYESHASLLINASCFSMGMWIARLYRKSSFLGILGSIPFALLLSSFITVPLTVECIVCITLATTFLSSILAQYGLKIYYRIFRGDSNADGYPYDDNASLERRAQALNVTPQEIKKLQSLCREGIKGVKKRNGHCMDALSDFRWQRSNSFKDIFHLLTEKEDKECLLILLQGSQEALESEDRWLEKFEAVLRTQNKKKILEIFLEILELEKDEMISKTIPFLKESKDGMHFLVEALKEFQEPLVYDIFLLLTEKKELYDLLYAQPGISEIVSKWREAFLRRPFKPKRGPSAYTFFSLPQHTNMDNLDLRLKFHKEGVRKAFKALNSKHDKYSISKEDYLAAIAPFFRNNDSHLASARLKRHWEEQQQGIYPNSSPAAFSAS
ncbi:MAG: hypothetical protein K0S27_348 [Gammaproteobacteria bacterium]|jgi:hypothetical protein|nr:hypothetical protein [Gammaproteobacteria bacterium]